MTSAKGTAELAGLPYALLWEAGVQGEADGGEKELFYLTGYSPF